MHLELAPYKYAGYPMLTRTIRMETADGSLFSKSAALLPAAAELAFHTCDCSALNAEELRRCLLDLSCSLVFFIQYLDVSTRRWLWRLRLVDTSIVCRCIFFLTKANYSCDDSSYHNISNIRRSFDFEIGYF